VGSPPSSGSVLGLKGPPPPEHRAALYGRYGRLQLDPRAAAATTTPPPPPRRAAAAASAINACSSRSFTRGYSTYTAGREVVRVDRPLLMIV
jgi:hypothetical protein